MPTLTIHYDGQEPIREIHLDIVLDADILLQGIAAEMQEDTAKLNAQPTTPTVH